MGKLFLKPFGEKLNIGMALPEVMISLFIVGASLGGTIMKFGDVNDVQRTQKSLLNFSQSAISLSTAAVTLSTLMKSGHSTNNSAVPGLLNCLKFDGSENCNESAAPVDFVLEDNVKVVAGTKKNPVYLKYNGAICNPKTADAAKLCAFALTSSYNAVCGLGGKTSCDIAQSIVINLEVEPLEKIEGKDAYWLGNGMKPNTMKFTREVTVSVASFVQDAIARDASSFKCDNDTNFANEYLKSIPSDTMLGSSPAMSPSNLKSQVYKKYLGGISWNGGKICKSLSTVYEPKPAGSVNVGPTGATGSTGGKGARGPRGPSGC